MSEIKIEPSADLRQFANLNRQVFQALVDEGFTEQQALIIIGQTIAASAVAMGGQQ